MTPKFQPEIDPDPHGHKQEPGFTCGQCPHKLVRPCEACGEEASRDRDTGLCKPCWRAMQGAYLAGLGSLVAAELGGEWRHRGITYSFSTTVLNEAGGVARLLAEWEKVKP